MLREHKIKMIINGQESICGGEELLTSTESRKLLSGDVCEIHISYNVNYDINTANRIIESPENGFVNKTISLVMVQEYAARKIEVNTVYSVLNNVVESTTEINGDIELAPILIDISKEIETVNNMVYLDSRGVNIYTLKTVREEIEVFNKKVPIDTGFNDDLVIIVNETKLDDKQVQSIKAILKGQTVFEPKDVCKIHMAFTVDHNRSIAKRIIDNPEDGFINKSVAIAVIGTHEVDIVEINTIYTLQDGSLQTKTAVNGDARLEQVVINSLKEIKAEPNNRLELGLIYRDIDSLTSVEREIISINQKLLNEARELYSKIEELNYEAVHNVG